MRRGWQAADARPGQPKLAAARRRTARALVCVRFDPRPEHDAGGALRPVRHARPARRDAGWIHLDCLRVRPDGERKECARIHAARPLEASATGYPTPAREPRYALPGLPLRPATRGAVLLLRPLVGAACERGCFACASARGCPPSPYLPLAALPISRAALPHPFSLLLLNPSLCRRAHTPLPSNFSEQRTRSRERRPTRRSALPPPRRCRATPSPSAAPA
jgi:hypothetical protein